MSLKYNRLSEGTVYEWKSRGGGTGEDKVSVYRPWSKPGEERGELKDWIGGN